MGKGGRLGLPCGRTGGCRQSGSPNGRQQCRASGNDCVRAPDTNRREALSAYGGVAATLLWGAMPAAEALTAQELTRLARCPCLSSHPPACRPASAMFRKSLPNPSSMAPSLLPPPSPPLLRTFPHATSLPTPPHLSVARSTSLAVSPHLILSATHPLSPPRHSLLPVPSFFIVVVDPLPSISPPIPRLPTKPQTSCCLVWGFSSKTSQIIHRLETDPEIALEMWDEAVRLDGGTAVTLFERGNTHLRLLNLDEAARDLLAAAPLLHETRSGAVAYLPTENTVPVEVVWEALAYDGVGLAKVYRVSYPGLPLFLMHSFSRHGS